MIKRVRVRERERAFLRVYVNSVYMNKRVYLYAGGFVDSFIDTCGWLYLYAPADDCNAHTRTRMHVRACVSATCPSHAFPYVFARETTRPSCNYFMIGYRGPALLPLQACTHCRWERPRRRAQDEQRERERERRDRHRYNHAGAKEDEGARQSIPGVLYRRAGRGEGEGGGCKFAHDTRSAT